MKQKSFAPLVFTTTVLTAQFLLVLRMFQFNFSLDAGKVDLVLDQSFTQDRISALEIIAVVCCQFIVRLKQISVVETKKKSL